MDSLYKAAKIFNKIAQEMQTVPTASSVKPAKAPKYTSEIKDNIEYRDRFHGAQGEERQKLIEEEAKKKGFTLIPDKITPVSESQVIEAVRNLVNQRFPQMDDDTKQEFIFTIVPQIKLETGYRPHNYNMGNAHAYPGWHGLVSVWQDPQIFNGKKVVNLDFFWRSFPSLEAGITDWFNLFEKRFPSAFAKALAGDVEGFSKELKSHGYYTADVNTYTKGLKSIKEKMKNKYYRDAH